MFYKFDRRITLSPHLLIDCLFVGGSLGREHFRSFSTATHGRTTLRRVAAVDFATLRPPQPRSYATHPPSSAQLHSLRAPSVARPKSGIWHCYAEPSVYVRCGQSPPPCSHPAEKQMRFTLPPLFVGDSLGREHFRSFSTATHGGTTLRRVAAVDFATLRPPQPRSYATHPPSSAQLHSLRAPSVVRPKSGIWHCYAEPSVYVRCGQSPPPCLLPACSLLQNITKLCLKEVGRVRLSGQKPLCRCYPPFIRFSSVRGLAAPLSRKNR